MLVKQIFSMPPEARYTTAWCMGEVTEYVDESSGGEMPEHGLERVLVRNQFYWEAYRRVSFLMLALGIVIVGLLGFVIYQAKTVLESQYFPTTPDGRLIEIVNLTLPLQTPEFVLNWTVQSTLDLYSFDYVTYRRALQEAQSFFTRKGYVDFMKALVASTNLEAVKAKKQVVSAELVGDPKVIRQGQISELEPYSWDLSIPLVITYQNSENEIIRQKGISLVRVERVSTLRYEAGIAIAQSVFQVER